MKIKNVITLTALSAMILSGCGTEPKAAINVDEYKPAPPPSDDSVLTTSNEEKAKYTEIEKYFSEWELPTEGVLPKDHKFYKGWEESNVIIYENGYIFDRETGFYEGRKSIVDNETPVATLDQFPGIVKSLVSVIVSDLEIMGRVEVPKVPEKLNWSGDYLESTNAQTVAIIDQFKGIVKYSSNKDLLKVSEEILKEAEAIKKRTSDFDKEETLGSLAEVESQYKNLHDKILALNGIIENAVVEG